MLLLLNIGTYISTLPIYVSVQTTYASPNIANATTSKSTPLMNTPFLLSLLHCDFEVNCGVNDDCIVDEDVVGVNEDGNIVDIDTDEYIADIDIDVHIVDIDINEDIITEIKNN